MSPWRFLFHVNRLPFLDGDFDITVSAPIVEHMAKNIPGENSNKQKGTARLVAAILGDEI